MKRLILLLAICTFASIGLAENTASRLQPNPHKSCAWCHIPGHSLSQGPAPEPGSTKGRPLRQTLPVCISCHDGTLGSSLGEIHDIHQGRMRNEPADCVDCHNPHDRSGSYRMLRGKHGPETQASATLGFCRGCHTEQDNPHT